MRTVSKTMQIIFFVISSIAFVFALYFFIMAMINYVPSGEESDLSTGLSFAVALIFNVISDMVVAFFSIINLIIHFVLKKKAEVNFKKWFGITNIVFIALSVIMFLTFIIMN